MVSTYLTFDLVNRDLQKTLKRVAGQTMVANDTKYYQENIDKVKTADDFLKNYRLYSYAMTAHGLEDMIYAKAFMKKVLESDLSDENSFANRLTDERYKNFAAAYNFASSSTEAAVAQSEGQMEDIFDTYDQTIAAQSDKIDEDTRVFKIMMTEPGRITNVDELLGNTRVREYLFTAYGIDTKYYNRDAIRGVLTSDPADPTSFYNTAYGNRLNEFTAAREENDELLEREDLIVDIPALQDSIALGQQQKTNIETRLQQARDDLANGNGDPDDLNELIDAYESALADTEKALLTDQTNLPIYQDRLDELNGKLVPLSDAEDRKAELAAIIVDIGPTSGFLSLMKSLADDFTFNADGSVPAGGFVTSAKVEEIIAGFFNKQDQVTHAEAMFNQDYFEERLKTATNVTDLTGDPRMLNYIKTAFNLTDIVIVKSTIERILTNDLGIVEENEATKPEYRLLYQAFNFASDGTVVAGQAQTDAQTELMRTNYFSRWDDKQEEDLDKSIRFYKLDIVAMKTVDDFISSDAEDTYQFALKAVGIDPATVTKLAIKNALKSDLSDPNSYIYKLKDERILTLAKMFNFNTKGAVTAQVMAQSNSTVTNLAKDYILRKTRFLEGDELEITKTKAETEAKYYTDKLQRIDNRTELLADRKMMDVMLYAKGIDPATVTNDFLKKIFTSDLSDPKSFANSQADKRFAQLVGTFNFDAKGEIDRSSAGKAQNAGEVTATQDLYMRQLLETQEGEENPGVRLALYFQRLADTITDPYVILGDDALQEFFRITFQLPAEIGNMDVDQQAKLVEQKLDLRDLADPVKLQKLVNRFTLMYDLENGQASSGAVDILNGNSGGISADTLWALSQIRMG